MIKRLSKDSYFKVYCNTEQKQRIQRHAKAVCAKSVSEYVLTVLLQGDTREYDGLRYKADGMLINAATYQKLGELVDDLRGRKHLEGAEIEAVISLIHEVRLEIATCRLSNKIEKIRDEN